MEQQGWADHALDVLRDAGYRSGGARSAVVDFLARQSCCLTAQEIFDRLRSERRSVGIASVYRVLELLGELRLVQRVDVGGSTSRYEPVLPGGEHHHPVVCDGCGKVEAFSDEALERSLREASRRVGYTEAHDVVLHGSCGRCD